MKALFAIIAILTSLSAFAQKSRVIVLTDISNEPDDTGSLVRFLSYSNEFEVEGLVATTSKHLKDRTRPDLIKELVEAYGRVQPNLSLHAPGFPSASSLLEKVKAGSPKFGMQGVGAGQDTEGSELIIKVVDRNDSRPVWVTVWGGANTLAQALYKVRETRSSSEVAKFISKLRVYTISEQDDSGPWIRANFPNLFLITSVGKSYRDSTWSGISGEGHYRFEAGADGYLTSNKWADLHVKVNHGPLGALYPHMPYIMEGDTPSFLYLIPNGLGSPEHPHFGSWGGRYVKKGTVFDDTVDTVVGLDGKTYADNHATIWRWREAFQNDFQARMDWQVKPFSKANHPPVVSVASGLKVTVKSGQKVSLSAAGTMDPDQGNQLFYHWFQYREAGSYKGEIKIFNADSPLANFIAPRVSSPADVHVVLAVEDNGQPRLTRYKRVIISVLPNEDDEAEEADPEVYDFAFYKGINLGGESVQISGNKWLGQEEALKQGLSFSGPVKSVQKSIISITPYADSLLKTMLKTSVATSGEDLALSQTVPTGRYQVRLWFMENVRPDNRSFDIYLEKQLVLSEVGKDMNAGTYIVAGPYGVDIRDGSLDLEFDRIKGDPLLMGIEILRASSGSLPSPPQPNKSPVVNAGADKTIVLPVSSLTLTGSASDGDGKISKYEWSKVSGPGATIVAPSSVTTTVSGLSQGSYVFRLTVTDDKGLSASDDLSVVVNPTPAADSASDLRINFGGGAVTVGSKKFISHADALKQGLVFDQRVKTHNKRLALTPATDSATQAVLNSGVYTVSSDFSFSQKLSNGKYQVKFSVSENYRSDYRSYDLYLEGKKVQSEVGKGMVKGSYKDLGPFEVEIKDGALNVMLDVQRGDGHLMSMEIISLSAGPAPAPVPAPVTAPVTAPVPAPPVNETSFSRRINFGGGAVSVGAKSYLSHADALKQGLRFDQSVKTHNKSLSLSPVTDSATKAILTSGVYRVASDLSFSQTLPNGVYQVKFQVTENYRSDYRSYDLYLEGKRVQSAIGNGMAKGTYQEVGPFEVEIKDGALNVLLDVAKGDAHLMSMEITSISSEPVPVEPKPTPNKAPVANAGSDSILILPASSLGLKGSASDADGKVVKYQWSKVSGGAASLSNSSTASASVSGLSEGSYVFRLTVTDDKGLTDSDDVSVTVKKASVTSKMYKAFGDSITEGKGGLSNQSNRYANRLASKLGVSGSAYDNYGKAGAGLVRNDDFNEQVVLALKNDPVGGIVTVMFGTNSDGNNGSEAWVSLYVSIVQRLLKAGFRAEDIYLMSPPYSSRSKESMLPIRDAVREAARRSGVRFIDLTTFTKNYGIEKLYGRDTLHPHDEGHRVMADFIFGEINR